MTNEIRRPNAGRSRSPRPDLTAMIIRLELLGYEYRGVDYNDGGYIYVIFDPGFERAGAKIDMLGGKDFGEIMERIGEMPILTTDPVAREVEMRTRRKAEPKAALPDPALQRCTERQLKFAYAIAREAAIDAEELAKWGDELFGQRDVSLLNRRDCSALIEALQRHRDELE